MRVYGRYFFINATMAALFFIMAATARADTYQLLNLSNDTNVFIDGIYGSGAAVLSTYQYSFDQCTPAEYSNEPCYITYVNGLAFSGSNTQPAITDAIGPAGPGCPILPSDIPAYAISFNFCANGHEVYAIGTPFFNSDGSSARTGVFDGPNFITDYIGGHYPSALNPSVNSYGDIVWDDVGDEEIIEAYDVTSHLSQVPEPSGWMLVGTGMLAALTMMRKRQFS